MAALTPDEMYCMSGDTVAAIQLAALIEGDDKVTCAGAPEAHDRALSFLSELT